MNTEKGDRMVVEVLKTKTGISVNVKKGQLNQGSQHSENGPVHLPSLLIPLRKD